jgi:hypothetical protein
MTGKPTSNRKPGTAVKRGGYTSSGKPASALKPPPKGPAPGGAKPGTGKASK